MWPYIKSLLTDEGKFLGSVRATLGSLGLVIQGGYLPDTIPHWLAVPCLAAALFMRSSAGKKPEPPK